MDKRSCFIIDILMVSAVILLAGCIQVGETQTTLPAKTIPLTSAAPTTTIPTQVSFIEEAIPYSGSVANAAVVAGKLLYSLRTAEGTVLVYDGKEYAHETRSVGTLSDVGGKIAYTVTLGMAEGGNSFIIYDGQEYGKEYPSADYPTDISGKLAYLAYQPEVGNMKSFLVYDGKEIGKEYDYLESLSSAGGKPLYVASRDEKKYVVSGGTETGGEYDSVSSPKEINGGVAYIAYKGDGSSRTSYVVYNGKESDISYSGIDGICSLEGRLAYSASRDGSRWFIVYDGQEIGSEYSYAKNPVFLSGAVAYAAGISGNDVIEEFVIYAGKKSENYDLVKGPYVIGEKIWFMGSRGGQWYIIRQE